MAFSLQTPAEQCDDVRADTDRNDSGESLKRVMPQSMLSIPSRHVHREGEGWSITLDKLKFILGQLPEVGSGPSGTDWGTAQRTP